MHIRYRGKADIALMVIGFGVLHSWVCMFDRTQYTKMGFLFPSNIIVALSTYYGN